MKIGLAVAASSLFALATMLEAQPSAPTFEVSPFAGYLFGGNIYDFGRNAKVGVDDHVSYGIRVGYNLASGLEPEIEWSRSGTLLVGAFGFDPPGLTINYALAGLSYNLSARRVRPYVSLALGVARLDPPGWPASETDFTGSLGIGLKTFVSPPLGFRFEARGYASRLAKPPFGSNCETDSGSVGGPFVLVACPSKPWLLNGEISGGLLFSF